MDAVRIGVIGVGAMGRSHASWLQEGKVNRCTLTALCDIDAARLEPYSGVKKFADSKELIRSGEVDAVIVATPHYDHTTIGIDALENGLHLLVEKPISVHKADCERLIAAHEKAKGQIFSAMFMHRTRHLTMKIKQLIDSGELGEIRRVNWLATSWFRSEQYYASGGWRATWKGEGGGVLLNQSPHDLDLMQWYLGMPAKLRATCYFGKYHDIETEDEVAAFFEYPNGATGVFIASTGEAPGSDRIEIVGDRGKLLAEGGKLMFFRNEVGVREYSRTTTEWWTKPPMWNIEIPVGTGGGLHVQITQNFVDAILDGTPLIAPAEDGIRSVELANAMIYSSLTDSTVHFPLDAQAYEKKLLELISTSRFQKKVAEQQAPDMEASFKK